MNKKRITSLLVTFWLILWTSTYLWYAKQYKKLEIVKWEAIYATDFSDDKKLMWASHNVFVAKIIKQSWTTNRYWFPETQYKAEIIENIKWDLSWEITVNQETGIMDWKLYTMWDESLFTIWSTYVFATRYNNVYDWYTVISHQNGKKILSNNTSRSTLNSISSTDDKIKKLKEAYKNEILLDADIKAKNTRNSYKNIK